MAPTVYTPPVNTYIPIGSVTLSATASEVVFSSLPTSGYRDLIVVFDGALTAGSDILLSLNSDTSNIYSNVQMGGNGSSAFSASFTRTGMFAMYGTADRTNFISQLMDYSSSDKHTTGLHRGNRPSGELSASAARWPVTDVVTSVSVRVTSNAFAIGSTFSLYAIAG